MLKSSSRIEYYHLRLSQGVVDATLTHENQSTLFEEVLQLLSDQGFDGMVEAIEILINVSMKLERAEALGALPFQRTESRRGYANGFSRKQTPNFSVEVDVRTGVTGPDWLVFCISADDGCL